MGWRLLAVGLLVGLMVGVTALCAAEHRLCSPLFARRRSCWHHAPIGWRCMRDPGHGGSCLPMRSRLGVAWDAARRRLRAPLERWRASHDRCPHCGAREAPGRDCGCPL